MKKYLCLGILFLCCMYSCRNKGGWPPIQMSPDILYFGSEGGRAMSVAVEGRIGWISAVIDTSDPLHRYDPDDKARGMSVIIKNEKMVEIVVDASSCSHEWTVELQSGDSFGKIIVKQNP